MRNRLITVVAVVALVAGLAGLAVVAGQDADDEPRVLPVLGAGSTAADTDEASSMRADGAWGGTEYRVEGDLPELDDEARAWDVGRGDVDEDEVIRLAETLGIGGAVRRVEGEWVVEEGGRELHVADVPGAPWWANESFVEEPAPAGDDTPVSSDEEIKAREEAAAGGGSASSPSSDGAAVDVDPDTVSVAPTTSVVECGPAELCLAPEDLPEPERPAGMPTKTEAERIGRELLADTGMNLDGASVRVDDGFSTWNVTVDPVIGGLPVWGMTSSVGVGPDGLVMYANGWLADPTEGDTYPLVGTTAGLERLKDEQVRLMATSELMIECVDCPPAEPYVVTITGVRLGLQLFSGWDADLGVLVPSYLFETSDGELPVVAIADEYLAEYVPEVEEPAPIEPTPEPGAVGSCASSGSAGVAETTSLQACVDAPVVAGETAQVTLTASAETGIRDDCGSPVVEWGDSGGTAVCDIGCDSLPPDAGRLTRTFEHVYESPGTYQATFRLVGCGPDYAEQASVTLDIEVVAAK